MVKMIRTDMQKVFGDCHIYVCILALGVIHSFASLELMRSQKAYTNFIDVYLNLSWSSVILFCFLICIAGGSFLYCTEEKYNYLYYEVQRSGVRIYTVSKLVISLVSGFIIAITGMMFSAILVSLYAVCKARATWPSMEEFQEFACELILLALLCGLLSAIGFLVTTFYANYYVAITAPILVYYALLSMYLWIPVPMVLQISKVYNYNNYPSSGFLSQLAYALLYTIFLLFIFYKIAKRRIQRRMEHA